MFPGILTSEVVLVALLASTLSFATFSDSHASGPIDITLSSESVGDRVDQSPNLEGGGFATPESRPRFQAFSADVGWVLNERSSLKLSLSRSELNSLRDSYEINRISLSAFIRVSPERAPYLLGMNLGFAVNFADQLVKNSFTHYNGSTLRGASINQPQDHTLHAGFAAAKPLGRGFQLTARLNAGLISSDHDSLQGQGQNSEGCQYSFRTNGSTGNLNQEGACGALVSYSQEFANEAGVEDRLGFRSSADVAYTARFWEAGSGMSWTYKSLAISLDYQIRQYFRGTLDQRIRDNGDTPTRFSQIARADVAYRTGGRWTLSLASIYQSAPFLDDIPLLYTAFTSERYTSGDSLSFQLSATFRL